MIVMLVYCSVPNQTEHEQQQVRDSSMSLRDTMPETGIIKEADLMRKAIRFAFPPASLLAF